jgi:hypothetical protein
VEIPRLFHSALTTLADVLADSRRLGETIVRQRAFLDAEAKRNVIGNGIRPIERVPFKIVKPAKQERLLVRSKH